jgi:PAS domain S-box-containing protein
MPLQESSKELPLFENRKDPHYDVVVPIEFQRQSLGKLHFGVNLSQIAQAREKLLKQGVGIAAIEIFLSSVILLFLGLWLTRHMKSLTQASLDVASGNLSPPPVPEGNDDVGRLGAAFNTMSRVISERVNELTIAKEIAEASEAQLRGITHSANDAILMIDPQGAITYWNPAAERILGYRSEEALGQDLHNLVIPEHALAGHRMAFTESLRTGRDNTRGKPLEFFARRKDGQEIAVDLSLSAVFLYGAWHAVGILRDITERKQHERELEQAREAAREKSERLEELAMEFQSIACRAEDASLAKSEFLANMSHEIRTPMNAIIGMSYLTLQSDLTSKQREQITHLHNAAESLFDIINDILDFSKVEAGKMTLEPSPFVLRDTLNEVMQQLKPKLEEKQLVFHYEEQDEVLAKDAPLLLGDVLRLRQILTNIFSNAIKFTDKGFVRLGVSSSSSEHTLRVVFTIEDSGIGMNSEQMARLFEEFSQADASTTRQHGGTGLGLAIARKLVALMDGKIDVESRPGQGSCFTVELPFAMAPSKQSSLQEGRESVGDHEALRGVRVLLVEDNPVNRLLAVKLLAMKGMLVDVAENGKQAVQKLESLPPETFGVVLMDLLMPELDGYETSRIIRSDPKFDALPIIALSSHEMSSAKERCRQIGMNGYINKPFNPECLWRTLLRTVKGEEPLWSATLPQPAGKPGRSDPEIDLNGVNLREGLMRAGGDGNLYAKIVEEALKTFASGYEDLLRFSNRKDRHNGSAHAHKLRGAFGAIGAQEMQEAMAAVEESFRIGADPREQILALDTPYAALMASLGEYVVNTAAPPKPEGIPSLNEGSGIGGAWLEEFAGHLDKGDFKAVELWEDNKTLLEKSFSPADLEEIGKALQMFDFARAREYLNLRTGQ